MGVYEDNGICFQDPIHGRNLDWPDASNVLKAATITEFAKNSVGEYYTVGFSGQAGVLTGVACERFSVSINAVFTDKVGVGQSPVFLLRQVLDECATFDQALKRLCKTKLVVGCLFLLTDGGVTPGKVVVIERTPDRFLIRREKEYKTRRQFGVICANEYVGIRPANEAASIGGELQESSCTRYSALEKALAEKELRKPAAVMEVMTQSDVQLCCTIHTVVMNPWDNEPPLVEVRAV